MNKRIQELAEQAGAETWSRAPMRAVTGLAFTDENLEKFAEFIVRECVGLCDQAAEENARTFYTVTETKEVGPALVAKGSQVQAEKLSKHIKQHFGVEE
jgi:hypothetical protein